jgi:hypothetical protein
MDCRRVVHEFLGGFGCTHDGVMVAVAFNTKANNRLASFGDTVDNLLGPTVFNPDHHDSSDVGVAARTNQRAEVQVKVRTELQAAVRVRNCHGALDGNSNGFSSGVGQVIQRQNDHMVTDADAAVIAAIAPESGVLVDHGHLISLNR